MDPKLLRQNTNPWAEFKQDRTLTRYFDEARTKFNVLYEITNKYLRNDISARFNKSRNRVNGSFTVSFFVTWWRCGVYEQRRLLYLPRIFWPIKGFQHCSRWCSLLSKKPQPTQTSSTKIDRPIVAVGVICALVLKIGSKGNLWRNLMLQIVLLKAGLCYGRHQAHLYELR
jgi:hypothetical protein